MKADPGECNRERETEPEPDPLFIGGKNALLNPLPPNLVQSTYEH
jgi:hypothetical protein